MWQQFSLHSRLVGGICTSETSAVDVDDDSKMEKNETSVSDNESTDGDPRETTATRQRL